MKTRRRWVGPQLQVLTRSNPEESILLVCKYGTVQGPPTEWGDGTVSNRCYCAGHVNWCQAEANS